MMNLNYLMYHSLHQIFKIILSISESRYETLIDNLPKQISVNKIENKVKFKIKIG